MNIEDLKTMLMLGTGEFVASADVMGHLKRKLNDKTIHNRSFADIVKGASGAMCNLKGNDRPKVNGRSVTPLCRDDATLAALNELGYPSAAFVPLDKLVSRLNSAQGSMMSGEQTQSLSIGDVRRSEFTVKM